jgi:hypothetical protein
MYIKSLQSIVVIDCPYSRLYVYITTGCHIKRVIITHTYIYIYNYVCILFYL